VDVPDTPLDQSLEDEINHRPVRITGNSGPKSDCITVRNGLTLEDRNEYHLMMQWHRRPKVVLLIAKKNDSLVTATIEDMTAWLASQGMVVVLEQQFLLQQPQLKQVRDVRTFSNGDELDKRIDLCVTLGGDGTLTWATSLFRSAMPPVLSFAAGSLGFLTPFPLDMWIRVFTDVLDFNRTVTPVPLVCRMRLLVRIHRRGGGAGAGQELAPICVNCLNEVLVHRGNAGALCKLDVGVDGERVTLVQGDGLILATPTGSTAYSLAAGGSMVHPAVPAILLTPVSPHSLSFRPALLPQSAMVTVTIPLTARNGAALSVDGKDLCTLRIGDSVEVAMSPHPVPTICRTTETGDWFASVNEALHWNGRKEQK
jgi:NAD+ kinase